jgi:hypothetical protein
VCKLTFIFSPCRPPPALLQYWTNQKLMPVPEGMPVVSAPPPVNPWSRRNSGSSLESAAERLSADFGRMNVEVAASERAAMERAAW